MVMCECRDAVEMAWAGGREADDGHRAGRIWREREREVGVRVCARCVCEVVVVEMVRVWGLASGEWQWSVSAALSPSGWRAVSNSAASLSL